jgi:hypothetical protein
MEKMYDPKNDQNDKEWCYAAKSTTVIGLPFMSDPVQITYDGAIYTKYAELDFFYDADLKPLLARNKRFYKGWMPIVQYDWQGDNGIDYDIEIFSSEMPGLGLENLVQHIRLKMKNSSDSPLTGSMATSTRLIFPEFRKGDPYAAVTPNTRFSMENNSVLRNDKLVFSYSGTPAKFAVPGTPYKAPFKAEEHFVSYRSETGLVVYEKELAPGEEFSAYFSMPRVPVKEESEIETVKAADYNVEREKIINFWNERLSNTEFYFPESRVNDSAKASMVHLLLATRTRDGGRMQGSGLPYDDLFLNDYIDMVMAYESYNLDKYTDPNVDWLVNKQYESGMFIDYHNRGNDDIVTSHGQGLFALVYKFLITRDNEYAEKVYPAVKKAVEFIINDHLNNNEHGILRPSIPYDAPMVYGYHSCHNLHALAAMRISIRMAEMLGEEKDEARWREMEKSYRKSLIAALEDAKKRNGYVTSGLFDWESGYIQNNPDMGENKESNQDWENNLLIFPSELYPTDSDTVKVTVDTIRRNKYREGCMTYRNNAHIHQYITINQAYQYMLMGESKIALQDFYHVLLHNGSTHEGFENLVEPWTNRTPYEECPPPHAWAAAKIALFSRNMLVMEYGGERGANFAERDLLLFSLVSPVWAEPGKSLRVKNAPTEMGTVSAEMKFNENGCSVEINSDFHDAPHQIRIRIPYFAEFKSFTTDASESYEKDGVLYFSPDVTKIEIVWDKNEDAYKDNFQNLLKFYRSEYSFVKGGDYKKAEPMQPFIMDDEKNIPPQPMSFELVKKAFLKEFSRRFDAYISNGGEPYTVAPPEMLKTDEARKEFFGKEPPKKNTYWEDNVEVVIDD